MSEENEEDKVDRLISENALKRYRGNANSRNIILKRKVNWTEQILESVCPYLKSSLEDYEDVGSRMGGVEKSGTKDSMTGWWTDHTREHLILE